MRGRAGTPAATQTHIDAAHTHTRRCVPLLCLLGADTRPAAALAAARHTRAAAHDELARRGGAARAAQHEDLRLVAGGERRVASSE